MKDSQTTMVIHNSDMLHSCTILIVVNFNYHLAFLCGLTLIGIANLADVFNLAVFIERYFIGYRRNMYSV